MSAEVFILIVLVVCVAYWYSRQAKASKQSTTSKPVPEAVAASPPQSQSNEDPFIQQIVSEKTRADAAVFNALQQSQNAPGRTSEIEYK